MKRTLLFLFLISCSFVFAENKISISTRSDKVIAEISINKDEYIILKEDFLFLNVISEHYEYKFSGYPEGEVQENGNVYYSDKLILKGELTLRDIYEPGEYEIEVVIGYQTCDEAGYCNIPVEVSQSILVAQSNGFSTPVIFAFFAIFISVLLIVIIKRKKS